jgi:hypothetical protein
MLKNIIITILTILVILFWLKEEPEDMVSDDPNDVTIEYKCNELDSYESVPVEVIEECRSRGYSVKNTI